MCLRCPRACLENGLVQHCANNSEYITCYLHQSCVVVSQQCHRIASFLRLVLSQISGTVFHCYLGNVVLAIDDRLEYARLYLEGNMQIWADAEDSLELY